SNKFTSANHCYSTSTAYEVVFTTGPISNNKCASANYCYSTSLANFLTRLLCLELIHPSVAADCHSCTLYRTNRAEHWTILRAHHIALTFQYMSCGPFRPAAVSNGYYKPFVI
ncbi:hypothetical protein SARC_02663, partial [Sphaeroforma arctica JP610]